MARNAYLVLPDLHYAVSKEHRVNYLSEVLFVLNQVDSVREKYIKKGYNVHLILLGDVIDSSIRNPEDAMRCQNLFRFYASLFSSVSCVVGNHEITYSVSNPFWFLVSSIDDEALKQLPKPLQPQGISPVFSIPATLQDGEVTFYFNHYGTSPKTPEHDGISIGLFHQNIGSNSICKMYGEFIDVEEASFVHTYNYSFFGHMHLAYGEYSLTATDNCICSWLGTCVGTNVTEVEELGAEFNIPAILVEQGLFSKIERNTVKRKSPRDCIDYTKLTVTRSLNEEIAKLRNFTVSSSSASTLFDRVMDSCGELREIACLLLSPPDELKRIYRQGFEPEISEE